MNQQLRKLLIVGGIIGTGYYLFNRLTSQALQLNFTRKLLQQIKHQMLIVTINYSEGCREHLQKLRKTQPARQQQFIDYFRSKLSDIFVKKEELILGKYEIPRQKFAESLAFHAKDKKIIAIQDEMLDMMDKSVHGVTPALTIDKRAKQTFSKQQIKGIYEDMSKMILVLLISKLQKQKSKNKYFDSNNDAHFKKAIRQLNIYDKKIEFFKQRGFKQQWGCPNQIFFKMSQGMKIQYPEFKKQMKKLQEVYEQVIDIAAKDPISVSIQNINQYYIKKQQQKQQQQKQQQNTQNNNNKVQKKQSHSFIQLHKATKSEPDVDQKRLQNIQQQFQLQKTQDIVTNDQNNHNNHNNFKQNQVARSLSLNIQHIQQQQTQQQPSNTNQDNNINIDDVPSDAVQLQKQLHPSDTHHHHHHHEKKDPILQQLQRQVKALQNADSNASVDGQTTDLQKKEQTEQVQEHTKAQLVNTQ